MRGSCSQVYGFGWDAVRVTGMHGVANSTDSRTKTKDKDKDRTKPKISQR